MASRSATVFYVAMVIPILYTILIVQMTQISNMKVISLMVEFLKIVKLWHLSIEFYGEWQKVATHHRTQYLTVKV